MRVRDLLNAFRARRRESMTERLRRIRTAVPAMNRWIDELLAAHDPGSTPVSQLGYQGLSACFPASLLDATSVVIVESVPFPPVSALGLSEVDAMAGSRMAGITFRAMYFLRGPMPSEQVHFHELVHAIQWRALGSDDFLLTYGASLLLQGYARNPLEAVASDLEARFKRGARPQGLLELVTDQAFQAREAAVAAFRACGLDFGG